MRRSLLAPVIAVLALAGAACTSDAATPPTTTTAAQPPVDPGAIRTTQITVGDLVFDAREAGPTDGDLVLLLHGFPQTSTMWDAQLEALGEAGYHAVAPDQRGYSPGARPDEVADYALTEIADDAVGMADALGAERFHLVGHDFGGAAAWVTADRHPDRLASMTSISTPHPVALSQTISDPDSDQADRSAYVQTFVQDGSEQLFLADDAALLRSLYAEAEMDEAQVDANLAVLDAEALEAALNWYRASFGPTGLDGAPTGPSPVPTLFIWSDGDTALGPDPARLTVDHVTGPYRFEVLEGVNHWVPDVAPDQVNDLLLEFLADPPSD